MTEHELDERIRRRIAEQAEDADLLAACIDVVERLRDELAAQRDTVKLAAQVTTQLYAEVERLRRALEERGGHS